MSSNPSPSSPSSLQCSHRHIFSSETTRTKEEGEKEKVVNNLNKARIACLQLITTDSKEENIKTMQRNIEEATSSSSSSVDILVLPEMWNCPYGNEYFAKFAEEIGKGECFLALQTIAREKQIVLFGGSIPTRDERNRLYNSCYIFDSDGTLIGTHHKLHLFDVDIPGGITFFESKTLTAGKAVTIVNTKDFGKFGVGICFDLRFPEYARCCALEGCLGMIYPGAFNTVTGPLHWELLQRCRAVDNQMFVATCSPARVKGASYQAHGYSSIYGPFGEKLNDKELEEKPGIVYADLDFTQVNKRRVAMPLKRKLTETYVLEK